MLTLSALSDVVVLLYTPQDCLAVTAAASRQAASFALHYTTTHVLYVSTENSQRPSFAKLRYSDIHNPWVLGFTNGISEHSVTD